jgi:hypothetical protein
MRSDIESFIVTENIQRFRRLLAATIDEAQRSVIEGLLETELDRARQMGAGLASPSIASPAAL